MNRIRNELRVEVSEDPVEQKEEEKRRESSFAQHVIPRFRRKDALFFNVKPTNLATLDHLKTLLTQPFQLSLAFTFFVSCRRLLA